MRYLCDRSRHLICEPFSITNLHRMADDLGISRSWYHGGKNPHYDIPKRQVDRITTMCIVVDSREIVRIIKEWRRSCY